MSFCNTKYLILSVTLSIITSFTALLVPVPKSEAEMPKKAVIDKIYGQKQIWIRRSGRPTPAQVGSVLERYSDSMVVNGGSKTHAILKFFSQADIYLNLFVKTIIHPQSAVYYFPCTLQEGAHLFGWGLQSGRVRGCENALKIQGGKPPQARLLPRQFASTNAAYEDAIAQSFTRQIYYCVISSKSGKRWLDVSSSDPCSMILEECNQIKDANCTEMAIGYWWNTEPKLTAVVQCTKQQFTTEGTGAALSSLAKELWQQAIAAKATGCSLQVYSPNDVSVTPASDKEVLATGAKETLIISYGTGGCPEVRVVQGAVVIRSAKRLQGTLVRFGNKATTNFCEQGTTEPYDYTQDLKSLDVEVLTAYRQNYPFCDEEQRQGGTEGDKRNLQLTTTQGVLRVRYEMYQIPDRMQIMYEGQQIYDSGLVSGSNEASVPFSGNSGRLQVLLTGNPNPDTKWTYTIYCPA